MRTQSTWLARWLGPAIDAAVIDGHRTLWQRLLVGLISALLLTVNFNVLAGASWFFIMSGSEGVARLASRRQLNKLPGTVLQRLVYIIFVALRTLNWAVVPLLYWWTDRPGLQLVSVLVASAMLIHAQAFTFRSRAMLAIQAGIPGGVLITLMLFYSNLGGRELFTATIGVSATLGYVAMSANANRVAARSLERSRDELETIAYSDALTALANRRRFTEDMRQLMDYSRRHGTRFALLLIDLDRFKDINDRLGHDVGDALLVSAARRLQALTSASDRIARLGGDEFAVLLADAGDGERIESFCRQIVESFHTRVDIDGAAISTTSSVGVAIYPSHGVAHETLYKAADMALYAAKNSGRNTWRTYSTEA
jgi:diguanylate cyclase (GGDEF)-like protein